MRDNENKYRLKWLELGIASNPFDVRVLDCRSFIQGVMSGSFNPSVAEQFSRLRFNDGTYLTTKHIPDSVICRTSLKFAHNGQPLHGPIFKADSMAVKWDIYVHDSTMLFSRSWTGNLIYRAFITMSTTEIQITEIECPHSDADIAVDHIYFLLGTHVMHGVLPHRLPKRSFAEDVMALAGQSYSLFGKIGRFATFDDITHIPITVSQ